MVCPTLVIFDHHIPVMDGMEFMEAFQQSAKPGKERIVFPNWGRPSQHIRAFLKLGVRSIPPNHYPRRKCWRSAGGIGDDLKPAGAALIGWNFLRSLGKPRSLGKTGKP